MISQLLNGGPGGRMGWGFLMKRNPLLSSNAVYPFKNLLNAFDVPVTNLRTGITSESKTDISLVLSETYL